MGVMEHSCCEEKRKWWIKVAEERYREKNRLVRSGVYAMVAHEVCTSGTYMRPPPVKGCKSDNKGTALLETPSWTVFRERHSSKFGIKYPKCMADNPYPRRYSNGLCKRKTSGIVENGRKDKVVSC